MVEAARARVDRLWEPSTDLAARAGAARSPRLCSPNSRSPAICSPSRMSVSEGSRSRCSPISRLGFYSLSAPDRRQRALHPRVRPTRLKRRPWAVSSLASLPSLVRRPAALFWASWRLIIWSVRCRTFLRLSDFVPSDPQPPCRGSSTQ
jgi:hypothetical protein